jgi:hypothetical protein
MIPKNLINRIDEITTSALYTKGLFEVYKIEFNKSKWYIVVDNFTSKAVYYSRQISRALEYIDVQMSA